MAKWLHLRSNYFKHKPVFYITLRILSLLIKGTFSLLINMFQKALKYTIKVLEINWEKSLVVRIFYLTLLHSTLLGSPIQVYKKEDGRVIIIIAIRILTSHQPLLLFLY